MRILKKLLVEGGERKGIMIQDLHMEVVLDWKRNLFSQKEMKLMNWRLWGDNVEQVKRTVQVRCVTYRDLQREYDESHLFIAVSLLQEVWVSLVGLSWKYSKLRMKRVVLWRNLFKNLFLWSQQNYNMYDIMGGGTMDGRRRVVTLWEVKG